MLGRTLYRRATQQFSPLDLSPVAYYKFNTGITESGGFVSVWADQSGNGNDLEQSTGTNQPAVSAGVITGDGLDNALFTAAFTLNQPTHIFIVMRQDAWTSGDTIIDGNTLGSGRVYQSTSTPNLVMSAGATAPNSNPDPAIGAFAVMQFFFSGASSFIVTNDNAAVTGNSGTNNMGGIALFSYGGSVGGTIAASVKEMVVFSSKVTGADLTNLYNYLAAVRDA